MYIVIYSENVPYILRKIIIFFQKFQTSEISELSYNIITKIHFIYFLSWSSFQAKYYAVYFLYDMIFYNMIFIYINVSLPWPSVVEKFLTLYKCSSIFWRFYDYLNILWQYFCYSKYTLGIEIKFHKKIYIGNRNNFS